MLEPNTRIPMTEEANAAVDQLVADEVTDQLVSLARNEPGEQGPVRLELSDGRAWLISDDGTTEEA